MSQTASTTTTEITEITEPTPQSDGTIIHLPAALLRPFCADKTVPAEVKDSKTLLNALRYEEQLVRGNTRAERIEWMRLNPNDLYNKAYWKEDFDFFKTDPKKPYPWKPITDGWMLNLRDTIKGQYFLLDGKPLAYSKAEIMECLTALAYIWDYDPFLSDFIYDLPKWDGNPRMDTLLTDMFGAADNKITRWASRYLLLGPIERAYKPGSPLKTIPVLIGKQGIGKSPFLRNLLPPAFQEDWYTDGLDLGVTNKERVEATMGRVIVEIADLQGYSHHNLQRVKTYISTVNDGAVRLSYRMNPTSTPRRFILVATADREDCLPNDAAGNTRFLPVHLPRGCNVEEYMQDNADQLWAEAYHYWENTFRPTAAVPRDIIRLAKEQAETYRDRDDFLEDKIEELKDLPYSLREIAIAVDFDITDMPSKKRLGTALKNCGWVKKRITLKGKMSTVWVKEDVTVPAHTVQG